MKVLTTHYRFSLALRPGSSTFGPQVLATAAFLFCFGRNESAAIRPSGLFDQCREASKPPVHLHLDSRLRGACAQRGFGNGQTLHFRQEDGLPLGGRQLFQQFAEVAVCFTIGRGGHEHGRIHIVQGVVQIVSPPATAPQIDQLMPRDSSTQALTGTVGS